jgi:hypothetical protein
VGGYGAVFLFISIKAVGTPHVAVAGCRLYEYIDGGHGGLLSWNLCDMFLNSLSYYITHPQGFQSGSLLSILPFSAIASKLFNVC